MKSMITALALDGIMGDLGARGPLDTAAGRSLANISVIASDPREAVSPQRKSRRVTGVETGREQMGDFIILKRFAISDWRLAILFGFQLLNKGVQHSLDFSDIGIQFSVLI